MSALVDLGHKEGKVDDEEWHKVVPEAHHEGAEDSVEDVQNLVAALSVSAFDFNVVDWDFNLLVVIGVISPPFT